MEEKKKRNPNGYGCFIELEGGRFLYRKSAGITPDGKRKVLTVRADTKSACIRLMKEKEKAWNEEKERKVPSETNTVADLCRMHLDFQVENDELKPKSIDRREVTIRHQIESYPIGHMQMSSINAVDVEEHIGMLTKDGLSVSSVRKALDVLNAAYEWAMARGNVQANPVMQVKRSIGRRLSKLEAKTAVDADVIVLSEGEETLFVNEALRIDEKKGTYKYAAGLYGCLLLHTGMRVGEMISLRWSDYDEKNGILTICKSTSMSRNRNGDSDKHYIAVQGTTKNQKARVIQLFPEAVKDLELIRKYRPGESTDLICRSGRGNPYTATMMEHCMETIYRNMQCDTKVSGLHIFRRTFATRMYENGADVKEIAAYIGDLESTTMRYYIAARKKMKLGDSVTQVVPLPGKRKVPTSGEDN